MAAFVTLLLITVASPSTPWAAAVDGGEPLPRGVVEIHVEDLHCNGCAKKLARKLYAQPGVKKVKAFVADDKAVITLEEGKEPQLEKLWEATKQAGQKPVALLIADRRYEADDFEQADASR